MAYARALVAGFDLDYIDDLLSFADAFGASRLREACINFMNLYKHKNEDRLWMEEIAAMQTLSQRQLPYLATSGIILAREDNDPSQNLNQSTLSIGKNGSLDTSVSNSTAIHGSLDANQDGKAQAPNPWPNHLPQYMQNFQGPGFQQMHPYQAYMFPGIQGPPYYPGNMKWPPNVEDSGFMFDQEYDDSQKHKSHRTKKKHSHERALETSEQDGLGENTSSSYESESDDHLQNGKRHSGTEQQHQRKHRRVPLRYDV